MFWGAASIFLIILLVAAFAMQQLHSDATRRVRTSTQNIAASVTLTIDGLFDTIDVSLQAAADEMGRQVSTGQPDAKSLSRYLELQAQRIPHVAYLRATNHAGDVLYGPGIPRPPINLADRDFFRKLSSDPNSGLFFQKPVFAKISQQMVITLARPVLDSRGRFAGTIYASIFVRELQDILGQIQMQDGASLALRDRDLGLIARKVYGEEDPIPIGSNTVSQPFTAAIKANPTVGSYKSDATSLDPKVRIYAYQKSSKYGFYVNAGVPADDELETWWRQVMVVGTLATLLGLALFALIRQAARSRRGLETMVSTLQQGQQELQTQHEQLTSIEAQHRQLLDTLQTGVIVHAPDASIVFINNKAEQLLGLPREQFLGKTTELPFFRLMNEAGQALSIDKYPVHKVIATGQPVAPSVVGVYANETSSPRWLQISAHPDFDDDGKLLQIVVNFFDITRRKEAEDRWKFALEGAGDGVWDMDMLTGQAVCSRRFYEMLGYAEGEVPTLHSHWMTQIHPEDAERARTDINSQANSSAGTFSTEYRLRCKDGSYKWIYARGMVVSRDETGKPLRMVGTNADISALKAAEQKAWTEANFDPLTHLPNRRLFYDRLEMKLRQAERGEEILALLFIDIDHFKEVNDTLGHHVGDALLVEAARRIRDSVRDYDTVARLGGDEFTVILVDQHASFDAGTVAQKIIDRLSEPFSLGHGDTYVSASIGLALYPDDALTVHELVRNADQAMYAAKNSGRHRFCFFTRSMQESAVARMALAGDLRRAVAEHQFEVFYQPIVSLSDGSVQKAEALMRWRHPIRGLVGPTEFIQIAEELGTINEMGDQVFMTAAAQAAAWQAKYGPTFQISVNKSPVQFTGSVQGHRNWIDRLAELQISGSSIVIEITETVLMDTSERVTGSLLQFRDAGIQVAIDDFGTGYSSLAYLKKFDIDYLKIDRSFVMNLDNDTSDHAVCEAIVAMAHRLGLKVIAEGVETPAQRDLLVRIGCDFAQGYLFSPPVSAVAFEDFMARAVQRA